jgi:hypothetical protein
METGETQSTDFYEGAKHFIELYENGPQMSTKSQKQGNQNILTIKVAR